MVKASSSGFDHGGIAIMSKVWKLLSSVKEISMGRSELDGDTDCVPRPELNSKWLALLTLEKACLSTVALEDTSGSVRRFGGHFKERLRELGGLDAVCNVALDSKVQKLLSSVKEINMGRSELDGDIDYVRRQELNSKWLALLTLEKACLSTVALEDTSGSVRRFWGHFKERLRELGGLDAVCNVALDCFAILKEVKVQR